MCSLSICSERYDRKVALLLLRDIVQIEAQCLASAIVNSYYGSVLHEYETRLQVPLHRHVDDTAQVGRHVLG